MIVTKNINFRKFLEWTWVTILMLVVFMTTVASLYHFDIINFNIPWLAISVIGTAVAFYVGFKNNQAYDRMWEARKIWGGIVNDSRTWGMMVDGFISNLNTKNQLLSKDIQSIKRRLIYRHVAWVYTHRKQLLVPTQWEQQYKTASVALIAEHYKNEDGLGNIDDEFTHRLLEKAEHDRLTVKANSATQLINEQSRDLRKLREEGLIDDFRHMELSKVLSKLYTLQGKNERIKKFPFRVQLIHYLKLKIN